MHKVAGVAASLLVAGIFFGGGVAYAAPGDANVAQVPPPGGLTQVVAGTTDLQAVIDAQLFEVASVWKFDVGTQAFLVFVPGAPLFVNSLHTIAADDVIMLKAAIETPPATVAPVQPPPSDLITGGARQFVDGTLSMCTQQGLRPSGLSADDFRTAVSSALARWQATGVQLTLEYAGDCADQSEPLTANGLNEVGFKLDLGLVSATADGGITVRSVLGWIPEFEVWVRSSIGRLIGLHPERLETIVVHEIGHLLGLFHSSDTSDVMSSSSSAPLVTQATANLLLSLYADGAGVLQLQPTDEAVLNPGDPGVTELSGLVTSGNDPLPGVKVQLRSEGSTFTTGTIYRDALTGSDGTYTILTERTGNVVLIAFAPTTDFASQAQWRSFSLAPDATGPRITSFNFPRRLVLLEEPPSVGASALPRVTWEAPAGATSYIVTLWGPKVPGVASTVVIQTEIEGTTIEPAAPVPDGLYEYFVRARDGTTVLAQAHVFFTVGAP